MVKFERHHRHKTFNANISLWTKALCFRNEQDARPYVGTIAPEICNANYLQRWLPGLLDHRLDPWKCSDFLVLSANQQVPLFLYSDRHYLPRFASAAFSRPQNCSTDLNCKVGGKYEEQVLYHIKCSYRLKVFCSRSYLSLPHILNAHR